MTQLTFVTGNNEKFEVGHAICSEYDVTLFQNRLDIDEVQSEDPGYVVRKKAEQAYQQLQIPVVVSDDAWNTPALNGFPGPYMKSIDYWFTPQNWLDIMRDITDRRIILIQQLAYFDGTNYKQITEEHSGQMLLQPRGSYGKTLQKIVTMPGDDGLSISEVYDKPVSHRDREVSAGWHRFIQWYVKNIS